MQEVNVQKMDVLNQLLLQSLTGGFSEIPKLGNTTSNSDGNGKTDFDSLINQKRQDATEPKEAPKAEEPSQKEVPQDVKQPQDPAVPEKEMLSEEITDEQYIMAAAMILQGQPDQRTVELLQPKQESPVVVAAQPLAADNGEEVMTADAAPLETMPVEAAAEMPAAPVQPQENVPRQSVELPADAPRQTVENAVADDAPVVAPEQSAEPMEKSADAAPVETAVAAPKQSQEDEVQAENVEVEDAGTALFKDVKSTPVKVAEPPKAPVELEGENGVEQLADKVSQTLQAGETRVELTLTPENLGKIVVEITQSQDGALHVALTATTHKAESLLQQHSENLQNLLAANGRDDVKVEVNAGQQTEQQQSHLFHPDEQGRQQQQQQQQQRQPQKHETEDFIQQLRLGLFAPAMEN